MNTADHKVKRQRQQTKTLEYLSKGESVTIMKCSKCKEKLIVDNNKKGVCVKCDLGGELKSIASEHEINKIGIVHMMDKSATYKVPTNDGKQKPINKPASVPNEGGNVTTNVTEATSTTIQGATATGAEITQAANTEDGRQVRFNQDGLEDVQSDNNKSNVTTSTTSSPTSKGQQMAQKPPGILKNTAPATIPKTKVHTFAPIDLTEKTTTGTIPTSERQESFNAISAGVDFNTTRDDSLIMSDDEIKGIQVSTRSDYARIQETIDQDMLLRKLMEEEELKRRARKRMDDEEAKKRCKA